MEINVVNHKKHIPQENDFYIGRGTPVGNPFSHLKNSKASYKVESRQEAIEKFRDWFINQIDQDNREICNYLNKILEFDQVNLVCFCKPQPCHGDFIREILFSRLSENGKKIYF